MGYTTEFRGKWNLNKPLDDTTFNFLKKFNETRRMKRNLPEIYGIEGEFFVDGKGFMGQDREASVVDYNQPPVSQPGLWCKWTPTDDRMHIEWDGAEKFYDYVEWIKYIISKVLAPRGYVLNGNIDYKGEDFDDHGTIKIVDNVVDGERLTTDYSINKLLGEVPKTLPIFVSSGKNKTSPKTSKKANVLGKVETSPQTSAELEEENKFLKEEVKKLQLSISTLTNSLFDKAVELSDLKSKLKELSK